jgi:formylglycine-generating enzyme required for sulfatase activity
MTAYRTTFMSHAHVDNAVCADLAMRLRALGVDAWIDLTNMQDGHSLSGDITYELVRRQAFVLLLTSASNTSHWVGEELEKFNTYLLDRRTRLVDEVERLIVPVLLEDNLATLVYDAEIQRQRASNWAKVFNLKMINAVDRDPQQVAQEIARALAIHTQPGVSPVPTSPPAPQRDWDDIALPARLDGLGFAGRRYRKTGVACIVPLVRLVPAGKFTMGSDPNDPQAYDYEKGQFAIPVGEFEIGQYPVTVAEYALAVQAGAVPAPGETTYYNGEPVNPAWRGKKLTWEIQQQQRADHPVVCVTWQHVRDYCRWLAQTTGDPWRLPTEAEWEKAARWDTRANPPHARIYPWGDQWDKARANTRDGGPGMTTRIGAYASKGDASPYGCHDMAGNVWEWTSTIWYDSPPYDYQKYDENKENDRDKARVLRGGSWWLTPRDARAACRNWFVGDTGT